ncbi:hypothetical protein F3157_05365 [Virgibacillus dakarensis]|uniref:hypothetical protein n=1 Tax=Virgibacillus dakarensis TaxID=1917889 RepID=UPI000B4459EE|nr:hypothetical protein [Virgibacillus dakarensis]MTW85086.1 hypothetical protein [Virgibacillus dakarensis]
MENRYFLFKSHKQYDQHTVVNDEIVPRHELEQLKAEGNAIEVDYGSYSDYRQKAQQLTSNYDKTVARIKKNDSPLWTSEVKDYELKKAWDEYEAETKAIQAEWEQERAQMQADAKAKAARATIRVSESDRQTAEQMANRIALNIASVSNTADLKTIIMQASDDITYLSDAEKTALQGQLSGILSQIDAKAEKFGAKGVSTRELVNEVLDIRNMDLLSEKVAGQLPGSITIEYDTKRRAKRRQRPVNVSSY